MDKSSVKASEPNKMIRVKEVMEILQVGKSTAYHTINELCYQLNVDTSAAYRRRDLALRRFTLALYGPLPGL